VDGAAWGTIGGSAVAIAALLTREYGARNDRRQTLALAREQHDHEARLALSARLFDGRNEAYQDTLRLMRQRCW
jgi:hypothetical protein